MADFIKLTQEQVAYMELAGAKKDSLCQIVEGEISADLGCCNAYLPIPHADEFKCGECKFVQPLDEEKMAHFAKRRIKEKPVAIIARHGQTVFDEDGKSQGWDMTGLDDNGHLEAARLATWLKRQEFVPTEIYCSDIGRAAETALIVGHRMHITPTKTYRLRPWNLGDLTGHSRKDEKAQFHFFINHPDATVPNGESLTAFKNRLLPFVETVFDHAQESGELPLIITHAADVIAINDWVTGHSDEEEVVEKVKPGGVLAVYLDGDAYRIEAHYREKTKE